MIEVNSMFPVMVVEHLETVKQYYEMVFGFTAVFYEPGFYLHLVSPNDAVQLGFLAPAHSSQPEYLHGLMTTDGYVISLEVKDAQQAFEMALQEKLNVVMPIKDEEWGQRHFMLLDPAGIRIDVVEHLSL